jgi:hypothetical protein
MPTKKKTEKKGELKPPKIACPPIPQEIIDRLIIRYSAPLQSIPDDSIAAIWNAVAELKGWMVKQGEIPVDPYGMRFVAWQQLRGMLNDAVEENNPAAFETMSKAWQQWEINEPMPRSKNPCALAIKDPWRKNEEMVKQKLAANIENLIPAIPTNQPNSLRKIEFLEAILDLQRRLKRAPTRREIEDKTEIKKNKVSEIVLEMGLEHLLSRTKATKE